MQYLICAIGRESRRLSPFARGRFYRIRSGSLHLWPQTVWCSEGCSIGVSNKLHPIDLTALEGEREAEGRVVKPGDIAT